MFVKCIDNSGSALYHLKINQVYKVFDFNDDNLFLEGVIPKSWYKSRFETVYECPRPLSDLTVAQLYTIARHANAYKATPGNHLEDCRGEMLELCRLEFLARGIAWPQHSNYTASALESNIKQGT